MRVTSALPNDVNCEFPVDHQSGWRQTHKVKQAKNLKTKPILISTLDQNRNSDEGNNQGQL